ncbi:MAG: thioredoxin domain-containing protein [Terriglobales bacterium]
MTTETKELNSLAQASSAYLRSAMHQPVRWREFGPEALAAAKAEDKPILLDIGAVWCHWCHVMDRESYDDPAVAAIINEKFIPVKVDRDERPDIDARYQAAVSAISGQGGWPLTAFLTPDGKPFYGGTYFPPMEHYGRPSFRRVLASIAEAYKSKRDEVTESAQQVMSAISQAEAFAGRSSDFSPDVINKIVDSAAKMFDVQHGGFGTSPKFPHPSALDLLIDRHAKNREQYLGVIINTTLDKMAKGGVYDQLAGGFHRYSVDERWVVPHFEKMVYDNSELLKNYVHGFQVTGNEFFAEVARDIIRWMDEWLTDRERGGFYASQDADINMDDDGDYFTWTLDEAREVLTPEEAEIAALYYGIGQVGEMHHDPAKNVLFVAESVQQIAAKTNNKSEEEVQRLLESAKKKMYAARLKRPTPYVDKTIYVSWNAMAISAYLIAARVLDLDEARRFALKSLDRILAEAWNPERGLLHVVAYSDPKAEKRSIPGMLDDYAQLANACIEAYESTADLAYFKFAQKITDAMIAKFYDATSGGFYDAQNNDAIGALAAQRKPFQDSPTPAGNPAAAIALLRLNAYTDDPSLKEKAEDTLEVFASMAPQYGMFAATYGLAGVLFSEPHTQVVVVGEDEQAESLYQAAIAPFSLGKSVIKLTMNEAVAQNLPPVLAATIPELPAVKEKKTVAILCSGGACQPPIFDPAELSGALRGPLTTR